MCSGTQASAFWTHIIHFLMLMKMGRLSGGLVLYKVRHEFSIPLLFKNCSCNRMCKEKNICKPSGQAEHVCTYIIDYGNLSFLGSLSWPSLCGINRQGCINGILNTLL